LERYGEAARAGGDGPASESPGKRLASLQTARGQEYQRFLDPWLWRDRIAGKPILFSVGANDPLFPPMSDSVFLPGMPKSTRILLIPNQGHGHDSERETVAWRMWLAHVFAHRPVPDIALVSQRAGDRLLVSAKITGGTQIQNVTVWSATDDRGAYLGSKWVPAAMQLEKNEYRAALTAPKGKFTAFWVEVEDEDGRSGGGVITTGMQEVRP